jgi:precorrin-6x reductase
MLHAVHPFGQKLSLAAARAADASLCLRFVRPEAAAAGVW